MKMRDSDVPTVIVGAGPYGLSAAAHLQAQGEGVRILGEPMQSWRQHMPKGMCLKSEGFASDIYDPAGTFTLATYCAEAGLPYRDIGDPVRLETFVAYGQEFQRRFVPQLERTRATHIQSTSSGFLVSTESGETLSAKRVIIASGITHFGYVPVPLSALPVEAVTHSSAHSDLSGFRGRKIAVLGGGSSAIDIAALLHESGAEVHLVARRAAIAFHEPTIEPRPLLQQLVAPRSGLGLGWRSRLCTHAPLLFHMMPERLRRRIVRRHLGPAPGWFMKDRVVGKFPMHLGAHISSVEQVGSHVQLEVWQRGASAHLEVDHVIAATGYRVDLSRIPFIDANLLRQIRRVDGAPVLNRYFETSVGGLYMIGLASANSFGPLARFAYGAGFTARRLAARLNSYAGAGAGYAALSRA
jgi:thioredoxin reductase